MDKVLIYAPGLFGWIGNLPGDIKYKTQNTSFYFPITSMIVISILLSILFKIFGK